MKIIEVPVSDILIAFFLGIYLKIVYIQLKSFYIYICISFEKNTFNYHVIKYILNIFLYH